MTNIFIIKMEKLKSLFILLPSVLDNLYNLVNYRFDDYLIVINFSEKNIKEKNETI